jgi:Tfp pilus assembly protein PilV
MVELMVTLVITTFGLMGLVALNTTFSRGGQSMNQTQEAVAIGKRVIEDLRSKRTADVVADLTGSSTSVPPIDRTSYTALAGRTGMTYTVDVNVAAVTATLWRVRVLVRWTDDTDGRTRQLPLELLRPSTEAL